MLTFFLLRFSERKNKVYPARGGNHTDYFDEIASCYSQSEFFQVLDFLLL
jgi:hypothetical protein